MIAKVLKMKYLLVNSLCIAFTLIACAQKDPASAVSKTNFMSMTNVATDTATFGAGCFWCVEAIFQQLDGVLKVTSGYSGGHVVNPTYEQVCAKNTGHVEVTQVVYDPAKISFDELLEVFGKHMILLHPINRETMLGHNTEVQFFTMTTNKKKLQKVTKMNLQNLVRGINPLLLL
jgi:peptide-methionine (S)-S-oxide reductase